MRATSIAMALTLTMIVTPSRARGQVRRSAAPDGALPPAAGAPRGIPRSGRHPYAGVWQGSFLLSRPGGDKAEIPVVMVFEIADSTKDAYAGFTVLPNGARAPHLETAVAKGEMQWKQQNSGGGFWVYTGRFVTQDSVVGTVILRDWPQLPAGEKPPTGSFAVARRPPGA
jgi:hypothetical protein